MFTSKDLALGGAHAAMAALRTENPAAASADGGVKNSADDSWDIAPRSNAQAFPLDNIIIGPRHRKDREPLQ